MPTVLLVLPIVAGVILGAPLIASDVERRTATLAWSIAPSRTRWLIDGIVVLGGIVALAASILAISAGALTASLNPDADLTRSFNDYEIRGLFPLARGFLAFGVAGLAGAAVGRVVPSVLLGAIAFGLLTAGLHIGFDAINRADAVQLESYGGAALVLETRIQDPASGRIVTASEAFGPGGLALTEFQVVPFGLPGNAVALVTARECAAQMALGVGALVATGVLVNRQRPM